jgi:hypothetical protein
MLRLTMQALFSIIFQLNAVSKFYLVAKSKVTMQATESNGTGTAIDDAMRELKQFQEEQAAFFKQQEEAFQQRGTRKRISRGRN